MTGHPRSLGAALAGIAALLAASCMTHEAAPPSEVAQKSAVTPEQDAAHPGKAVFDRNCAACHANPQATRAPATASLRLMRRPTVEYAITVC